MSVQDKAISAITLLHAASGIAWTLVIASQIGYPFLFIAANLALACVGIAASVGWFKRQRWAAYAGLAFYSAQLVHVLAPDFQWSFTLGLNLNISFGWFGGAEVGINFIALVLLAWWAIRTFAPNNSSKPTPLRGAA